MPMVIQIRLRFGGEFFWGGIMIDCGTAGMIVYWASGFITMLLCCMIAAHYDEEEG